MKFREMRKMNQEHAMIDFLETKSEANAILLDAMFENEQRMKDLAKLRGRKDLLPALDRAK